jgi:hypothetical protein
MASKVDPAHPDVQALTTGGFDIDRLTQLVNKAAKPIAHEAISQATEESQAQQSASSQQALAQQLQALLPPQIPALNTQTMQNEAEIPAMFQQALSQLVTPPIPANPQPSPPSTAPLQATQAQNG